MNENRTILVASIVGTILFIIAIATASYAYYTSSVKTEGEGSNVSVTTEHISATFTDGASLHLTNMIPGDTGTKEITITNTGSVAIDFKIAIKELSNGFTKTSDVVYKIKDKSDGSYIKNETPFPSGNQASQALSEEITLDVGATKNYTIEIEYKNTEDDQSTDMGKTISGKLFIEEV